MALRIHVDRCELSAVSGWIDDNGPVLSIDIELNGHWICNLSPTLHRRDLEAAGFGDGKRAFSVSLIGHLRFARFGENRITIKRNGISLYEGPVRDPINLFEPLFAKLEAMAGRLERAEGLVRKLTGTLHHEQYRIDAALFHAEGLTRLRDEFLQARLTDEYQAVFSKDNPLVSVCVTTMNRPDLLVERALASICAQSYRNLQVIVVGDHCTDDTEERVAGIHDSRISFFNLPKRGPYPRPGDGRPGNDRWRVAGTWPGNHALSLVKGEFVTHLDEDDTYEPQRIEILLEKIRALKADLVFHPFWRQQPDGRWVEMGNGRFDYTQTSTGTVLYHRYLARLPWDVYAYRFGEPEDWNRFRKFKMMRASIEYVPQLLTRAYCLPPREPFVAQDGEEFLD